MITPDHILIITTKNQPRAAGSVRFINESRDQEIRQCSLFSGTTAERRKMFQNTCGVTGKGLYIKDE
jgi:hypothetical protein